MQTSLHCSSFFHISSMFSKVPQISALQFQHPRKNFNFTNNFKCKYSSSVKSLANESQTTTKLETQKEDQYTVAGLRRDRTPKHVAVILDGNRRWFQMRGLPLDYDPFLKSNMLFAELCLKWGIGTATSFIYALENMRRSQDTNDLIFQQFQRFLEENLENFIRKRMRVTVIGESSMYPESLKSVIKQVEEATSKHSELEFMLALCYGGTRDVVHATRSLCRKVKAGLLHPEDVNEAMVEGELMTKNSRAPHVDLLFRTGGNLRLSNYIMWQLAEAELYFTNTWAPEFEEDVFLGALRSYQQRERTFGK